MGKSKTILLITLFIVSTINTIGQIREITEVEYNTAKNVAQNNFEKFRYKQQTNNEEFENGKLISSEILIEKNLPPDKNSLTSVETVDGKTTKIEIITIGKICYQRANNRKWTKSENRGGTIPTGAFSGDGINEIKKYTVEATRFNNQAVNVYGSTTIYNFSPNISHVFRSWINKDNLIVKVEVETEISSGNIIRRSVSATEFNPKILTINAPIIKAKTLEKRLK